MLHSKCCWQNCLFQPNFTFHVLHYEYLLAGCFKRWVDFPLHKSNWEPHSDASDKVGRYLWRPPAPTPALQAGPPRASCPEPCPEGFWRFQEGGIYHLGPVLIQSHSEKVFPDAQRKPLLFQFLPMYGFSDSRENLSWSQNLC